MSEKRLIEAYDRIEFSTESRERIRAALDRELLAEKEDQPVKKTGKALSIALIAAVISVLFITSAYAVSGVVQSRASHFMKDAGTYTSLMDLDKVEKTVGFPVTVPEKFENGYMFRELYVGGEAALGESNEVLKEFYNVMVTYERDGAADLTLDLSPVLELPTAGESPKPSAVETIDSVEVRYSLDHYKFVPAEGYEKTPEDLAAEAAGHYYISYGSDEVEEFDFGFADFILGDVEYVLFDHSGRDAEFLGDMAAEVIAAAQEK